jgi:hypothetical protein
MNVFQKRFASAALVLSLTAGGALFAQDRDGDSDGDAVAPPPVVVVPVPQADDGLSRDSSSRDWRGEVAADREAKGWGPDRVRTSNESRQNWIREYQDLPYRGGDERRDRFRDAQQRSDRIGQNRRNFTPMRPDARSDAETHAQAYAAMYWMMKAQAEREEADDDR